ncbi:WhiB family transcriptional regulator [Rhodococcoides fascians]|uniref:WhiB family transcriptional regulator n=1 Tax=Rhodococcoides fascians TaxID=1828 RepID=UPI000689459C|nr:WhiB family transcriptional regulator [Rhodococcus fascians]
MTNKPGVPQNHKTPFTETPAGDLQWQTAAACHSEDPELFFPNGNGNEVRVQVLRAQAVCLSCPIASVIGCARQALDTNAAFGVWGGEYLGETRLTRHAARQRLAVIAGRPAPQENRPALFIGQPCRTCKRVLRGRNTPVAEAPGTVKLRCNGYCDGCWEAINPRRIKAAS